MLETAKEKASADVETELIAKAKNGDKEAFNRIIELHQNEIYRIAYRMLDDRDDALDIVQETFFRAYRSLKKFRGDSSLRLWLEKIASNICISRYRRKRVFVGIEEVFGLGKSPRWDDEIDADAHRKLLSRALATLTPRERAVFVLRMDEQLAGKEVAETLGIAEGTVKTLLHRANEKMRMALKKMAPKEKFI